MTDAEPRVAGDDGGPNQGGLISEQGYRRLAVRAVLAVCTVAIVPLLVMSGITFYQYQQTFRAELTRPMVQFADAGKLSLEAYFSDRLAALSAVAEAMTMEELRDQEQLDRFLSKMQETHRGIVDLGVIDDDGIQVSYAGPHPFVGKSYAGHKWLQQVRTRGSYVSDVFMGYRNIPHIVLATRYDPEGKEGYVLRATLDANVVHWLVSSGPSHASKQRDVCGRCHAVGVRPFADEFIVNTDGVLQTPSRLFGDPLEHVDLPPLPKSRQTQLTDMSGSKGGEYVIAYAQIERSPFTLVVASPRVAQHEGWESLRRDLILFPAISVATILAVVIGGVVFFARRARDAELKRVALYHKMEYSNKLAAIGRLGAGVAHEINNPLAIITQKAGLLKDLLTVSEEMPPRERMIELIDSVLKSTDRCGGITHRLLGFAKHMDVEWETIDLDMLLREVLGFLDKEASYRSIVIDFAHSKNPPNVISDRGQLQQVFLNIVNNAFAAVDDGGRITICIEAIDEDRVAVRIEDDGVGIPKELKERIFDPFFTTKKGVGTGLGLSVTYGIVQKLGGQIDVRSVVGEGTCFTVILPIRGKGN